MKEKEIYLADLRSLKENITNKIMEAIQDLEAKNLKKIEKKIEKASQKIALGLIKASLKNAEILTRKVSQAISPLSFSSIKEAGSQVKRGRPSLKLKVNMTKTSGSKSIASKLTSIKPAIKSSNKTSSLGSGDLPKRRGRPAKQVDSNTLLKSDSVKIEGRKRGRPFGSKAIITSSATNPSSTPQKLGRGRPRLNKPKLSMITNPSIEGAVKAKRGRPSKVSTLEKKDLNTQNNPSTLSTLKNTGLNKISAKASTKAATSPKTISSLDKKQPLLSVVPKKRGRKPKIPTLKVITNSNESKDSSSNSESSPE